MPLSFSLLRVSSLVIWRPALLPWGDGKHHGTLWQALVITEAQGDTEDERGLLSHAFCSAATLLSPACNPAAREASAQTHPGLEGKQNEGSFHMQLLTSSLIAKRQEQRDLAPDLLASFTKHRCVLLAVSSQLPARHMSFLKPVLQFLLPVSKPISGLQPKLCYQYAETSVSGVYQQCPASSPTLHGQHRVSRCLAQLPSTAPEAAAMKCSIRPPLQCWTSRHHIPSQAFAFPGMLSSCSKF